MIELEICTYNLASCLNALQAGANRVELCSSFMEGGTTPSYGLIKKASSLPIDVMCMIRPKGGDFLYSDDDFDIMQEDILMCKQLNIKGVVFGILNKEGKVDKQRNKVLLSLSEGMDTCFHRAVDMSSDYFEAIKDITDLGFKRVLTSGGYSKAIDGMENIKKIQLTFGNDIQIMVGSGVNPQNIPIIYEKTKVKAFHLSAKKTTPSSMIFQKKDLSMSSTNAIDEYSDIIADKDTIEAACSVIKALQNE